MRIIYTIYKKGKIWIVKCASDTTIKVTKHKSRNEAITKFFTDYGHEHVENFDIVIPLSVPKSLIIHKPIRRYKPPKEIIPKYIPVIDETSWGNRPIPKGTIQFKHGLQWIVAIHPYYKQNIYYLNYPLPETNKVIVKRGSLEHDVQIINGKLKHDVFLDLGDSQAHVFIKNNNLMLEYFNGQKASFKKWKLAKLTK
jgi:hypothetical protein